ncbi:MAG: hypothetical protein H8D87_01120 [Deltaproteobacteria bacterium]|uniref:hypothetical protein n=1 Tax=Desulfobacula sp. TaxID=2593537 RepID=UPI0019A746AD|nr:hypothetical protein [Candidatus Desulfobacula maris]MBL6994243.1 hypothetical protein [Desulfobacula sp.]
MSKYDSDYQENDKRGKQKTPKFREYYDEDFTEDDDNDLYKRKKKLGKIPKRKKSPDHDWPAK